MISSEVLLISLGYLLAGATHIAYIYAPEWRVTASWMARLALGIHTLALAAEFWQSRTFFASFYEATLFFTWAVVLVYVLADLIWPVKVGGTFLIPAVLVLVLISLLMPRTPGIDLTGLTAARFFGHIIAAIAAYGFFSVAFILSALYLLQERQLRNKEFRLFFYRLPPLESLDYLSHRLIQIGFPLLTLALAAGYLWARDAWTGNYATDSKLIWTWITWGYYGIILIGRALAGLTGRRFAWFSIAGFLMLMVNYFVINLFWSNVHGF